MGGIMKHLFKPEIFKKVLGFLLLLLIIKTLWFVVEVLFLPAEGINQKIETNAKSLYYRVKLTPNKKAAIIRQAAPQPVVLDNMKNIKLLAIYGSSRMAVATVVSKGKTKVLSRGEDINGFVLSHVGLYSATFSKHAKSYTLQLLNTKKSAKSSGISIVPAPMDHPPSTQRTGDVTDLGDHKVIDRSLLDYYANNMEEIYQNIGVSELRENGKLDGFKLTFVRRDSPFAKLGIRRNDVIQSINGQKITSYNAAFEIYKNIKNIENLTLTIKRGNEEMELEYEIN